LYYRYPVYATSNNLNYIRALLEPEWLPMYYRYPV
jgi:hypothetical protein